MRKGSISHWNDVRQSPIPRASYAEREMPRLAAIFSILVAYLLSAYISSRVYPWSATVAHLLERTMIIETSTDVLRKQIKPLLVAYLVEDGAAEAISLYIAELIAWRMTSRADYQVTTIGAFVRINLLWLKKGRIRLCTLLERFTKAAVYAGLGHDALVATLVVTAGNDQR